MSISSYDPLTKKFSPNKILSADDLNTAISDIRLEIPEDETDPVYLSEKPNLATKAFAESVSIEAEESAVDRAEQFAKKLELDFSSGGGFVQPEKYDLTLRWGIDGSEASFQGQTPEWSIFQQPTSDRRYLGIRRAGNNSQTDYSPQSSIPGGHQTMFADFRDAKKVRKVVYYSVSNNCNLTLLRIPSGLNDGIFYTLSLATGTDHTGVLRWYDGRITNAQIFTTDESIGALTGGVFTSRQQLLDKLTALGCRVSILGGSCSIETIDDESSSLGYSIRISNLAGTDSVTLYLDAIIYNGSEQLLPQSAGGTVMTPEQFSSAISEYDRHIPIGGFIYHSVNLTPFTCEWHGGAEWETPSRNGNRIVGADTTDYVSSLYGDAGELPGIARVSVFDILNRKGWLTGKEILGIGSSGMAATHLPDRSRGWLEQVGRHFGARVINNAVGGSSYRAYGYAGGASNRAFKQAIPDGFSGIAIISSHNDILRYLSGTWDGGTVFVDGLDDETFEARLGNANAAFAGGAASWVTDGEPSDGDFSTVACTTTTTTVCESLCACIYRLSRLWPLTEIYYVPVNNRMVLTQSETAYHRIARVIEEQAKIFKLFGAREIPVLDTLLPEKFTSPAYSSLFPDTLHGTPEAYDLMSLAAIRFFSNKV